jgi:hypothetical protein
MCRVSSLCACRTVQACGSACEAFCQKAADADSGTCTALGTYRSEVDCLSQCSYYKTSAADSTGPSKTTTTGDSFACR